MIGSKKPRIIAALRYCVAATATVLLLASATQAQTTALLTEGFNSQESSTFRLEGQFVQNAGSLWNVIPGFQPGLPTIIAFEQGDARLPSDLDPSTTFAERRATFFIESQTGDQTSFPGDQLDTFVTNDALQLLEASLDWLSRTDASENPLNIQFSVEGALGGEPMREFDFAVRDYLQGQGHTVNVTAHLDPYDGSSDLIFLAASNGNPGVLDMSVQNPAVPILTGLFHRSQDQGLATNRGENTNNTQNIDIVPGLESHPLAGGLSGEVQVINDGVGRQRLTQFIRGGTTLNESGTVVATTQRNATIEIPVDDQGVPTDFTGFEGEGYLRGGNSANVLGGFFTRAYEPSVNSFDTTLGENPRLVVDLGATEIGAGEGEGPFDPEFDANGVEAADFDFINILADDNGDGEFDVLLGEFRALTDFTQPAFDPNFQRLALVEDLDAEMFGAVLGLELQTFEFELPAVEDLAIRIEVRNQGGEELVAIDNLQILVDGDVNVGLMGDYNDDGIVDAADYTVWRDGLSPDSSINGYLLWRDNFGQTSSPGAGAVPEPAAGFLLIAAVAATPVRRRRATA